MSIRARQSVQLGDLVAAVFDQTACVAPNPQGAAELASVAVIELLLQTGRSDLLELMDGESPRASKAIGGHVSRRNSARGSLRKGGRRGAPALAA